MKFSFIIPALNEEKDIGFAIDSIVSNMEGIYKYEVIVVDNGSTDHTAEIAKNKGAIVICDYNTTIGSVRNAGVAKCTGEIIVFIDADVYLKNNWAENIDAVIKLLKTQPLTITGSMYSIPEEANWIEKNWFGPEVLKNNVNYINSGHLIMSKELFEKLGGFKESLETGEDYELCQRAKRFGVKILNNPRLLSVHLGFPKTIGDFFKRERWHGLGDYANLKTMLSYRIPILSLSQVGIFASSIFLSIWYNNPYFLFIYILFMIVSCVAAAFYKVRGLSSSLLPVTILCLVYFIARSLAFFDAIFKKFQKIQKYRGAILK